MKLSNSPWVTQCVAARIQTLALSIWSPLSTPCCSNRLLLLGMLIIFQHTFTKHQCVQFTFAIFPLVALFVLHPGCWHWPPGSPVGESAMGSWSRRAASGMQWTSCLVRGISADLFWNKLGSCVKKLLFTIFLSKKQKMFSANEKCLSTLELFNLLGNQIALIAALYTNKQINLNHPKRTLLSPRSAPS